MPDDNSAQTAKPQNDTPSMDDLLSRLESLESRLSEVNQESAARRKRIQQLEEERDALKQARTMQLEQEGNYKALADERAQKLAELESYYERANALEKTIREANEARMANVPEHMRGLIPTDYSPERLAQWLDNNQQVLNRPIVPDFGAGMAGGNGQSIKLTSMQKDMARRFGMTDEQYASALQRMDRDAGDSDA